MMQENKLPFDLVIIALLSVLCALISMSGFEVPLLRGLAGLLLVLVLPGLAIRLALFPKKIFGMAEQILVVIGTSIMLAACLGVILNAVGVKLEARSWSISLTLITLIICVIAGYRRLSLGLESPLSFPLHLHWSQLIFLAFASIILVGAFSFRWLPLNGLQTDQGYTILWIKPDPANSQLIHTGVNSNEFSAAKFRVAIVADGKVLHEWQPIELAPGEKWETTYELKDQTLSSARVEVQLYKLDNPDTVYRQVWLAPETINGSTNAP